MTLFRWVGGAGPDWNSSTVAGTVTVTNWLNTSTGKTDTIPSAGDNALFNNGGAISVGGGGDANEVLIQQNTTLILTDGRVNGGEIQSGQTASPFDLSVEDGSKLIIQSGAGMQNGGSVSVVGIGAGLGSTSGTATMEVQSGGLFTGDALIIGDSTEDAGAVTVSGGLEFVIAAGVSFGNGELTVGNMGTGSLDISATPVVFTQGAVLGLNQGAAGTMSIDSSTWGGGDVTVGAAGIGHMTVGAGAVVALHNFVVGAAQTGSGDLTVTGANSFSTDFLTIGASGTGTAAFELASTGTFAAVTVGENTGAVANMTLDGASWQTASMIIGASGTGHVTAGAGEVVTVSGTDILGSGQNASGDLTVDGAVLNGGTLVIGQDGTGDLEIGAGSSGSVTVVVVAEDADASGTLTIDNGANWSAGSLSIGPTGTGQASVGTGATATIGNLLIGPNGDLAVSETSGSVGSVVAQQVTIDFGTLDLSGFGQVLVGAPAGVNGAVAIGNNASVTGLGLLNGNVVLSNGGQLQATAAVPGALKVDGNISGDGTIRPLMTLEANGAIDAGVTIGFSPSIGAQVGDLVLDVPAGEQGTITGFAAGNTIDIRGTAFTDAVFTQGISGAPGTLMLSGTGVTPLSLAMLGIYSANAFTATPVTLAGAGALGASGLVDTIVTVACFAAGTRIATDFGDARVEDLRVGQYVRCRFLGFAPITWIGSRQIDLRRHPNPEQVRPVRIRRHAFADGMPSRDLYLSPDHAVYTRGVLVPVRALVNGTSVAYVPVDAVSYYHVELARHDVLFAEGLDVESYLDVGDRHEFASHVRPAGPRPDRTARAWETMACAPLLVIGPEIEAIRRQLTDRAGRPPSRPPLGPPLGPPPGSPWAAARAAMLYHDTMTIETSQ